MRLIDADKVELRAEFGYNCDGLLLIPYRDAKKAIDDAPTVDAVQMVRCRDCIMSDIDDSGLRTPSYDCPMYPGVNYVDDDDFCSMGKRRTVRHEND